MFHVLDPHQGRKCSFLILSEYCIYCICRISVSFVHLCVSMPHALSYYPSPVYSHAVDVVRLGAGEAIQALPPLAICAPSLRGRLHALKH